MAFRFVHTADIHLDSPLRSLALRDPELSELIGNATRRSFSRIIDLCIEERVDALMIAGDLYDGDQTSMKTAFFLAGEMKRLDDAGIRTFIIRGNHDHLARITKELELPGSAHVFGGRAELICLEASGGLRLAIHGLSFSQAVAPESLLPRYRAPAEGAVNIGLMHTSLGGAPGHDPYAPCSLRDLELSGFRYWALGHIHIRSRAGAACAAMMPGIPQGRDVNESGPKSATLVTVSDDGSFAIEERVVSVAQFERVVIDVGRDHDWRSVVTRMGLALETARDAIRSDYLVARLTLTGSSSLAWRMRRDADLLRTEAKSRADALGRTAIDKVEIRVAAPDMAHDGPGPFDELRRSMQDEIRASLGYGEAVRTVIDEMRQQLPAEVRQILGDDEAAMTALAAALTARGCDEVLARLIETGGTGHAL